jgi:hypothetical protein
MQLGNLVGGAWNMAASVANVASAFKDTGIFHLGESAVPDIFFSFCGRSKTGEATEPDGC